MIHRSSVMVGFLAFAALASQAQTGTDALAEFEVASVKVIPADNGFHQFYMSPYGTEQFSVANVPLDFLIALAFGIDYRDISGAPGWLHSQFYEIHAKARDGVRLTDSEVRPRMQRLLAERFKLATHREKKDVKGYALMVARGGPKLQASSAEPTQNVIFAAGLRFHGMSIAGFANGLRSPVGRPVVDETGIKGNYDISIDFAPEGDTNSRLPSIFTALREQLGLQLEPRQVPVEMLVIDHVERIPSEN